MCLCARVCATGTHKHKQLALFLKWPSLINFERSLARSCSHCCCCLRHIEVAVLRDFEQFERTKERSSSLGKKSLVSEREIFELVSWRLTSEGKEKKKKKYKW